MNTTLHFAKEQLSHLFADLDHPGCSGLPQTERKQAARCLPGPLCQAGLDSQESEGTCRVSTGSLTPQAQ